MENFFFLSDLFLFSIVLYTILSMGRGRVRSKYELLL